MGFGSHLVRAGNEINVVWVPAHSGVEVNEYADGLAKEVAEGSSPHGIPDEVGWQVSLSHLFKRASERRARVPRSG